MEVYESSLLDDVLSFSCTNKKKDLLVDEVNMVQNENG